MDKQPEALLLAEMHEDHEFPYRTAKELRRLHYLNQELVEALEEFIRNPAGDNTEENAIAILAKYKEQA